MSKEESKSRNGEPYRAEPSGGSAMFPWRVVGPTGVVSGHPEKRDAEREARQWNRVYELGRQSVLSELPRWIPCSERLPEGEGNVLLTHKTAYNGGVVIRSKNTVRSFLSDTTDRSMADAMWMPLPDAPQPTERNITDG